MTQHLDLDALQAAAEERNSVGAQLANVAFNWKQKCGHKITQADCDMLALLQLQWDASINVVPTIIDRLRKAEAASKWISVDEQLPETFVTDDSECWLQGRRINAAINSVRVLVALSGQGVRVDRLAGIEGNAPYWETYKGRVTHWMPLPAAPRN